MSLPPPLVLLLKASTPLPSLIYYCKISVALPSVQQLNYIKCCHLVFRDKLSTTFLKSRLQKEKAGSTPSASYVGEDCSEWIMEKQKLHLII